MKGDSGLRGYYEKWQAVFESETKDIAGSCQGGAASVATLLCTCLMFPSCESTFALPDDKPHSRSGNARAAKRGRRD